MATAMATARISKQGDRDLRIERVFDAPLNKVWRAYTEPALLAQWWGRGNRLVIEQLEVKPGGKWRFVEHAPDGVTGFEGEYREVTPRKRLVQTFGWDGMKGHESVDTATFNDLGDGRTSVVTISTFEAAKERDAILDMGMAAGLNESYSALDRVLASMG